MHVFLQMKPIGVRMVLVLRVRADTSLGLLIPNTPDIPVGQLCETFCLVKIYPTSCLNRTTLTLSLVQI